MWHFSLHRHRVMGQHKVRLNIVTHPSWWNRLLIRAGILLATPNLNRPHHLLMSIPIPLTWLVLDVWRPMRSDELERLRSHSMDGWIGSIPEEIQQQIQSSRTSNT